MGFLKCIVHGLAIFCVAVDAAGKIHRAGPRPVSKNGASADEVSGDYNPWLYSLFGTLLVGLTGIFPLLVIPVEAGHKLREGGKYVLCILNITS